MAFNNIIDPKTGLQTPRGSLPSTAGYTYNPNTPQGGGSDQPFTGTVGSLGFGNLFEGTTPLSKAGSVGGAPSPQAPLSDIDPGDAGVDISAFSNSSMNWKQLIS